MHDLQACLHIQFNIYLRRLHGKGGQVVGVLFVPRQSHEWQLFVVLIQYGGVLQVSEGMTHHSTVDTRMNSDKGHFTVKNNNTCFDLLILAKPPN